jgi:alpha-aminoadipic semialdehyde synthase
VNSSIDQCAGKGNVTKGALEIFTELPHEFVDVSELPDVVARGDRHVLYGVMIDRHHSMFGLLC